jgi:hypothetical protein
MRVAVELEPPSVEAARILGEWQAAWGGAAERGGVELAAADSLTALLDLKERCYDRGVTISATFPDNLADPQQVVTPAKAGVQDSGSALDTGFRPSPE